MPLGVNCSLPWEAEEVALSIIAVSSLEGCEFVLNSFPVLNLSWLLLSILISTSYQSYRLGLANSALQRRRVRRDNVPKETHLEV